MAPLNVISYRNPRESERSVQSDPTFVHLTQMNKTVMQLAVVNGREKRHWVSGDLTKIEKSEHS